MPLHSWSRRGHGHLARRYPAGRFQSLPPFTAEADEALIEVVRHYTVRLIRVFVRRPGRGRRLSAAEIELIESAATGLAAEGFTDEALDERIHAAKECIWAFVTRLAIADETSPATVIAVVQVLHASGEFLDDATAAIRRAYQRHHDAEGAPICRQLRWATARRPG